MASTLKTSLQGLEIVDRARRHKGWNKTEVAWQVRADVSKSTLDRFWMQKPIKHQNFVAICEAVGVDWEQVVDLPAIEPTNITRKSNLDRVNQPVVLELEEFGQQIFDWFGALDFTAEGLPRREGKYVEWIIRVPARRRFDRVLIRATIHEVGLSDLDSLRRGVAQLRLDEGWLVTNLWVSQSVRQALNKSDDDRHLDCLAFDELIDRDANFTPYLDWLEREIGKREIDRYYVDLGCTKGEFDADTRTLRGTSKYSVADGGIDRYIDRWLENPVTEHVSILGEFGTGKTWFAFHYAGKCLQAYREAKFKGMPRPRLPLVIPLRDYAKALNVENVLAGFFYTQHNIRLNSDVFDRLNRMGKLLLIFDGFDEMADKIDTQKMTDNFWELAKVVTPNAKVILTCRTEHFPTAQDGRENMSGERTHSLRLRSGNANTQVAVAPKFETLELMKFDDEQIRAVLSRRTNVATVELVMANSQLLDLLRRAVMAEFVLEALPEIEAGKPIDLARVYLYAVRHKMERDITTGRTFTSLADKLYFLCELAWEMLSEDKMSINYREFPDRLRVLFKNEVKEQKHLDHWHYDMMGQTMLIRNDDGDYSPAHRSLLEFFVAYKFAAELGLLADDFLELAQSQLEVNIDLTLLPQIYTWSEYWQRESDTSGQRKPIPFLSGFKSESPDKLRETFGKSPLTRAMLDLLKPALNLEVQYRQSNPQIELIQSTQAADVDYSGGNAATILVEIEANALEYHNLSGANLAYANLVNAGLKGTDLNGTNLENCLTTGVFGTPNAIAMSKDDLQVITAHDDNTIRIWDRASGRELQKLIGHQGSINCLALSTDGQFLYSGSNDRKIVEWKLDNSELSRIFDKYKDSINCLALSNDGQLLYSGSNDGTIVEWKLDNGKYQRTFDEHQEPVSAILLNHDGQFLYSSSQDRTIKKWELANEICLQTFEGHQSWVREILLSKDEQTLYSGSHDGTIKKWSVKDRNCQLTFEDHQSSVMAIALSKDDRTLYSGSYDRKIKEWNVDDGICQRTFEGHQDLVTAIALSGDGKLLYSGDESGVIKAWKVNDGSCQRIFKARQDCVTAIALSRDGQTLYSGGEDGVIKEWKVNDGSEQHTFKAHQDWVTAIALSKDGQTLYSGSHDRTITKWSVKDRNWNYLLPLNGHTDSIRAIALSRDEQSLYSGSHDRTIKKWSVRDGNCQDISKDHRDWLRATALTRDGQFLYSGGDDGTIKKWKVDDVSCQHTFTGHQHWVRAISLSDDEQLLYSSGEDNTIKEWNTTTGECLRTIDTRLCAGANITNVKGLTPAQTDSLIALGAIDHHRKSTSIDIPHD